MLSKTANYLARRLLNNNVIKEDSFDIYVYGFELLISFLFSTLLVIASGIIIGKLLETLAFLVVFIFLRSYSGGYHAKKYSICTIVTLGVYAAVILLSSFINVNAVSYLLLWIVGFTLLFLWAPIENPNKEITNKRKIIYKWISILLFVIFLVVGILFIQLYPQISNTVFFTLCADIILMLPEKLRKGDKKDVIL